MNNDSTRIGYACIGSNLADQDIKVTLTTVRADDIMLEAKERAVLRYIEQFRITPNSFEATNQ